MPESHKPQTGPAQPAGPEDWEVSTVTLFRALGYAVGLPAFMVGTAMFMLGFSLGRDGILDAACMLYALAFSGIGGRVALGRFPPADERAALKVVACVLAAAAVCYGLLRGLTILVQG